MAERLPPTSFDVADGQPLIGVPLNDNGRQVVRYFADDADADTELLQHSRSEPRELAGAWLRVEPDLEWSSLAETLDRLRHESVPTPPIDID